MAKKKAKKKAAKKKVAAKATSHVKSQKTVSKEVLVDAPLDADQEPVAPKAFEPEPVCYSRSRAAKRDDNNCGQTQFMTVAEYTKAQSA
jgi:hypothetical protein